jgi:hypothetical protein
MLSYELAKALHDAGFPQSGSGTRVAPPDMLVARRHHFAYVPTLEEVIEACGEKFGYLSRDWLDENGRFWCAVDRGHEETVPPRIKRTGATPVEAVARLWLALNKQ